GPVTAGSSAAAGTGTGAATVRPGCSCGDPCPWTAPATRTTRRRPPAPGAVEPPRWHLGPAGRSGRPRRDGRRGGAARGAGGGRPPAVGPGGAREPPPRAPGLVLHDRRRRGGGGDRAAGQRPGEPRGGLG